MSTLNKQEFLQGLQEQAESQLSHVLNIFQNLNENTLTRPAQDGGWSVCECLEHLNTYARYYLPRLERALSLAPKDNIGIFSSGWLGRYFRSMMNPDNGSRKYKAAKIHLPVAGKPAYEVVAEFIGHQENLCRLLATCAGINLNAVKVPASIGVLIRLNAGDTLAFLITHNERHIRQANRNLSAVA